MTKPVDQSDKSDKILEPVMTYDEIAELLNITRTRVVQIEQRALRKLRKQFNIDLEDLL